MKTLARDTHPKIEAMMIERYRQMSPAEKFEMMCGLNAAVRQLAYAGIKQRHPNADSDELNKRYAALVLDRETMIRVYNWDPKVEGY